MKEGRGPRNETGKAPGTNACARSAATASAMSKPLPATTIVASLRLIGDRAQIRKRMAWATTTGANTEGIMGRRGRRKIQAKIEETNGRVSRPMANPTSEPRNVHLRAIDALETRRSRTQATAWSPTPAPESIEIRKNAAKGDDHDVTLTVTTHVKAASNRARLPKVRSWAARTRSWSHGGGDAFASDCTPSTDSLDDRRDTLADPDAQSR